MLDQALYALKNEPVFSGWQSKSGEGTAASIWWCVWAQGGTLTSPSAWDHQWRSLGWRQENLSTQQDSAPKRHLHSSYQRASTLWPWWWEGSLGQRRTTQICNNASILVEKWLVKHGRKPSELSYLCQSKLCVLVTQTVSGILISYQNGGGDGPRSSNLSLLFSTLLYTRTHISPHKIIVHSWWPVWANKPGIRV